MDDTLSPEQEAFCRSYAELANGAEAYRRAYPRTVATSRKKLTQYARRLRKLPKVQARIAELLAERSSAACTTAGTRIEPTREAVPARGRSTGLPAAQEAFAQHYARHGNGSAAFRAAYPDSRAAECRKRSASRAVNLRRIPKVAARIAELREQSPAGVVDPGQVPATAAELEARREAAPAPGVCPSTSREPAEAAPRLEFRDWERLALLAFDSGQPDMIRLAALRCLTAGLVEFQAGLALQADRGVCPREEATITVTITIGGCAWR